jgi:hypothetical protein
MKGHPLCVKGTLHLYEAVPHLHEEWWDNLYEAVPICMKGGGAIYMKRCPICMKGLKSPNEGSWMSYWTAQQKEEEDGCE